MKKMLLMFVLMSVSSGNFAQGAECFDSFGKEGARLAIQIGLYRNVWSGYEAQRFVYAFSNKKLDQTVLIGAPEEDLVSANMSYERCELDEGIESYFIHGSIDYPENGLFDIRYNNDPGADALSKFVIVNATAITQIALPNAKGLNHKQVARTAIHEAFHGVYQFSSGRFKFYNPQPRDFLVECRQNKVWNNSVIAQNKLLLQAVKETDNTALRTIWAKIKSMREELDRDISNRDCLDSQRYWERIEGTAHFVETESAHKIGLISFEDIENEMKNELNRPQLSETFFYYSGNILIRMARSLGIENWSGKIDQGTMIDMLQ